MEIFVNGEAHSLPQMLSVAELLSQLGVSAQRLAVEVNREIVPRSAYTTQRLQPGDRVEMVQAVGGG